MPNKAFQVLLTICLLGPMSPLAGAADSDTLDNRRNYLESISAAEKDELHRRQERFDKLSAEEQEKLRQIETRLADDPQGQRLRRSCFVITSG